MLRPRLVIPHPRDVPIDGKHLVSGSTAPHVLSLPGLLLLTCSGCLGLVANLIQAGGGNMIPAAVPAWRSALVAVVCVDASLFGSSHAADDITSRIENRLRQQIPSVQLISQQKISDWIDREGWDETDYRELGVGVEAQIVVGIDT